MNYQYKIFFSWQSDNKEAKKTLNSVLNTVVKQLKREAIAIEIIEGGGGEGFISIEDAVRMKIQKCDIFIGDVTPVGKVTKKKKLLPNANVMYEMGIATESMTADRIIAVAMEKDWDVEKMPFDFNHYSMVLFKNETDTENLSNKIKDRIKETDKIARRLNNRFFSERLLNRNILSGKYLPDTFLENRDAKESARFFSAPYKMYDLLYSKLEKMSFAIYNKKRKRKGQAKPFKLNIEKWNIKDKTVDIDKLYDTIKGLLGYLRPNVSEMDKDGNHGWTTSLKVRRLADKVELLNKKILVVTSEAGQGKTNFVCDLVNKLFQPENIPYVFVNAYELLAELPAVSIAHDYNYIGSGSLEDMILKAERYCQQNLQYLIIVIDGLNENIHQRLFRNNLARVLGTLIDYHHVKVILTCRKTFFEQNYTILQEMFKDELAEICLDRRNNSDDKLGNYEADCVIERYAAYFKTKGNIPLPVRKELLNNLLLLRIFFETYSGTDISKQDYIDKIDLYERYFKQVCDKIQKVIELDSRATNVDNVVMYTFQHVIQWMIENDCFRNIPYDEVVSALPQNEAQSFESFLNSNLILRHDSAGIGENGSDVINFTFEEMRDFLTINYMLKHIFTRDSKKFWELVDYYTSNQNNQAEGIKRFLFLYTRNKEKKEIFDALKQKEWYEEIFNYYIWNVKEELLTDEDVKLVKELIIKNSRDTIRLLSLYHWSPQKHRKINLNILFEVLDELEPYRQIDVLNKAWDSQNEEKNFWGGPDITERSKVIEQLMRAIKRKKKDNNQVEAEILEKYVRYLMETSEHTVYVPSVSEEFNETPYVIRGYGFYRYLMIVHKGNKKDFLQQAGTMKGFSKQMFGEIYDAIFEESEDVEELYNKYYKKEYPNISQFISMHYNIPKNEVKQYTDAIATGKFRIIDFSSLDYGSSSFENLFSSDDMFIRMYNWLNWKNDENKN